MMQKKREDRPETVQAVIELLDRAEEKTQRAEARSNLWKPILGAVIAVVLTLGVGLGIQSVYQKKSPLEVARSWIEAASLDKVFPWLVEKEAKASGSAFDDDEDEEILEIDEEE